MRASTPLAPLAPLPSVSEDGSGEAAADGEDAALRLSSIEEGEHDSGTETLQDSDSDPDDQDQTNSLQEDLIGNLVGWNVSKLTIFMIFEIRPLGKYQSFVDHF